MNKRIIAYLTLVSFGLFSYSCYMTKQINVDDYDKWKEKKAKIIGYTESSGKEVRLSNSQSGEIEEKRFITAEIVGKEVMKGDIRNIEKTDNGEIVKIETIEGDIYRIISITEKDEKFVVLANRIVHMPLSEIASLLIRAPDVFLTVLALLPVVLVALTILSGGPRIGVDFDW